MTKTGRATRIRTPVTEVEAPRSVQLSYSPAHKKFPVAYSRRAGDYPDAASLFHPLLALPVLHGSHPLFPTVIWWTCSDSNRNSGFRKPVLSPVELHVQNQSGVHPLHHAARSLVARVLPACTPTQRSLQSSRVRTRRKPRRDSNPHFQKSRAASSHSTTVPKNGWDSNPRFSPARKTGVLSVGLRLILVEATGLTRISGLSWWIRRDSNPLPPHCKCGALPIELPTQNRITGWDQTPHRPPFPTPCQASYLTAALVLSYP